MKIKIVRCSENKFWYRNMIGDIMTAIPCEDSYRVIKGDNHEVTIGYVDKQDCIVIEADSKLKDVCVLLGIEWDANRDVSKLFKLENNSTYYISIHGDLFVTKDGHSELSIFTLQDLILGRHVVIKIEEWATPINCSAGQMYKYIKGKSCCETTTCTDAVIDFMRMKLGNMFDVDDVIPQEQIDDFIKQLRDSV